MPNWVCNRLRVSGPNANKILKGLLTKSDAEGIRFDFNKILPMPEDLNIISGSTTDKCFEVYLSTLSEDEAKKEIEICVGSTLFPELTSGRYHIKSKEEIDEIVDEAINNWSKNADPEDPVFKTKEDVVAYGKRVTDNIKKYGSKDWYDWCVKNWGTKWNACNTIYAKDCPDEIQFDTAWSDVRNLILKLSEKYPELEIVYDYAEEQVGYYAGHCFYKNGCCSTNEEYGNYTKEAYEMHFDLWGEDDRFVFDEKTNNYKYIEDEDDEEMS